jgi:hypothetical protein
MNQTQRVGELVESRRSVETRPNRRKEFRYPTHELVQIELLPGRGDPVPATVIDVAKSGLRLELVRPLPRCSRIEILFSTSELPISGEVRYCHGFDGVYYAGIFIDEVVHSRPLPEHLHDDEIPLYVGGDGLSTVEVLRVEQHLSHCVACHRSIRVAAVTLYPAAGRLALRRNDSL